MSENYKKELLKTCSREALKDRYGIIYDAAKIHLAVTKLKSLYYSDYIDYGNEEGYFIRFNMKAKVILDSIFEKSRQYMIQSRCKGDCEDRCVLLDIYDLVYVYAWEGM